MTKKQTKSDSKFIPVFEPFIGFRDRWSVFRSISNKNISGTSPVVSKFENEFAALNNRQYGIAVSNGSVALDLSFASLELKEGDEVVLPSHTIISCLASVVRNNGTPVFCDVDKISWNMSLENIQKVVTNKTKVILMVHTFGLVSDAIRISKFCKENNIILIEDAAEAHGQIIDKKRCGSFGLISTFSFYANKHVTTGEGGMVLTDSESTYKRVKQMRNLDFSTKRFQHDNLYWNYRLGGLQASLGLSQIKKLDKIITKKKQQGKIYHDLLSLNDDMVQLQPIEYKGVSNHYWVFGVLLKNKGIRDRVIKDLLLNGIETRPFFYPLHLQNALPSKFRNISQNLDVSVNLGENGLYLPMGNHINKNLQKRIVNTFRKVIS